MKMMEKMRWCCVYRRVRLRGRLCTDICMNTMNTIYINVRNLTIVPSNVSVEHDRSYKRSEGFQTSLVPLLQLEYLCLRPFFKDVIAIVDH